MPLTTVRWGETDAGVLVKAAGADEPVPGAFAEAPEGVTMRERIPGITRSAAPWYELAKIEEVTGVEEVRGSRHNPRILEYHATTSLQANDDETPWCSSFVNWCIVQCGLKGTNSALARSWATWQAPLDAPREGCIVVLSRTANPAFGHVAFYAGERPGSRVLLLGGNQGDQVAYSTYPKSRIISMRWPTT